jgi:hypothetical protein
VSSAVVTKVVDLMESGISANPTYQRVVGSLGRHVWESLNGRDETARWLATLVSTPGDLFATTDMTLDLQLAALLVLLWRVACTLGWLLDHSLGGLGGRVWTSLNGTDETVKWLAALVSTPGDPLAMTDMVLDLQLATPFVFL